VHVTLLFVSPGPRTTVAPTSAVAVAPGFVTVTSNCAVPPPGTGAAEPDIATETRSRLAGCSVFPPALDPPAVDPPPPELLPFAPPLEPLSLEPPPPLQADSRSARTIASVRAGIGLRLGFSFYFAIQIIAESIGFTINRLASLKLC